MSVLEAVWLDKSFRGETMTGTPRIAVYVASGWFDKWPVRWELYHATRGRKAIVYCLGNGMQDEIHKYCCERGIPFDLIKDVPSLTYLRLVVKPSLLIAVDKGAGVVSKYAREAGEVLNIPVTLRNVFQAA